MEKRRANFFLLRSELPDEKGRYQYVQHLISPTYGDNGPSLTFWPEYAKRFTKYKDVIMFNIFIHYCDNFVNKQKYVFVEYEMEVEQVSWAKQPEQKREYQNLLLNKDASSLLNMLSDQDRKEIENFEKQMEEKYGNSNK